MKTAVLVLLNLSLVVFFFLVLRKKNSLAYNHQGRWWLTWLSIAVITLMDELTSVFYAPAEAFRFIGVSAILFIAFTSILIHYMTTRLVEIAEILEHHGLIGGGVYSFSYLVLGPVVSFIAVASIMVDYILTACISAVSAVANATSFFQFSPSLTIGLVLAIIWIIAGLNILGIRENARVTFIIFIAAAFIILNLISTGIFALDSDSMTRIKGATDITISGFTNGSWTQQYRHFISSIAFCILAYSGVESVLQTAGLVRNWREVGKAYLFLACTVGLVTPLIAGLALSAPIDFKSHEGDLITYYATMINGIPFGIAVAVLASMALIMAVNTAFVASSELIERVADRYGFDWLIAINQRNSLYRIHLLNAVFFSVLIWITAGRQETLADMYALGLVASFCINMGSLFIYRYFKGTKEIIHFSTSRLGTLAFFIILLSCFIFLALQKPHGTLMWASVTSVVLLLGMLVSRKRAPERREREKADSEMSMILYLAESSAPDVHIYFRRTEEETHKSRDNAVFITFFSPRAGIPPKTASNHFRFPLGGFGIYNSIVAMLRVVEYELADRQVFVHLGWPLSSWLDRFAIGIMVFNLMRLPRLFPRFQFHMSYLHSLNIQRKPEPPAELPSPAQPEP